MDGRAKGNLEGQVVRVEGGPRMLEGNLRVPVAAGGLVLSDHGSGSSRHSPRNRFVAGALQEAGLSTLLLDLLTPEEEAEVRYTGHLRFDIGLLAERLVAATRWAGQDPVLGHLPVGYFG